MARKHLITAATHWIRRNIMVLLCVVTWGPIAAATPWNSPHPQGVQQNIRFGAFSGPPKTLDPARAYSSDETQFLAQIYEPPLQYHYLKRPYQLVPLTASIAPKVTFLDANGKALAKDADPNAIAYTLYDIYLRPGIYYQPHPALAKDQNGHYRYHHLSQQDIADKNKLSDFKHSGTRELHAADYVYQIKRLANPFVASPIFGVMQKHIVGFNQFAETLKQARQRQVQPNNRPYLDLRRFPLAGAKAIDRYHYQIKIKGYYPQFKYWLAMPFFAPIPWEADAFYGQKGMADQNLTLSWYPIGTGPYYLAENNPNSRMVLKRNPNFRGERYPTIGAPGDAERGYLQDAGKPMPFVDQFVFSLDKESIPRWNKFLQGYYDKSGISADSFDQAIKIAPDGSPQLTKAMQQKGIRLRTTVNPSVFYLGFNMLDPVVGGNSTRARKLRQAIAIAIDYEEYIAIFLNGRGIPAQGPIPPGIFGYRDGAAGINQIVYRWQNNSAKRQPLQVAKKLLAEAGYPGGRDPKTGRQLILNYDVATTGNPDDKARLGWMREQFAKLGIKLNIRSTQYNRFQDKIRSGNAQIFSLGWMADYPDPENFLFLLYGPNSKVKHGGENASNYHNKEYDQLFSRMKVLPNGPKRQAVIDKMLAILRRDSPWVFGLHPIDFTLTHQWNRPSKPHGVANNLLKYERLNPKQRQQQIHAWNKPMMWPLWLLIGFILVLMLPLIWTYWRREKRPTVRRRR